MSQAYKDLERRICRDMGLTRRGQVQAGGWARGSDNDDTGPVSIEVKYTKRHQLPKRWVDQARDNGENDGRPWFLFQGEHKGPGHKIDILVTMEYDTFLPLWRAAVDPFTVPATPASGPPVETRDRLP